MKILLSVLFCLNSYAIPMDPIEIDTFSRLVPKGFDIMKAVTSSRGMPDAFVYGFGGRCQMGVGVCLGMQYNVFKAKDNTYSVSRYVVGTLEAGAAEIAAFETYVGACYGDCQAEQGEGLFLGTDATYISGVGMWGFIESGVDLTDFLHSGVVYVGGGYSMGAGAGISLGLTYYKHLGTVEHITSIKDYIKKEIF